jgi:SH3-like domain-containing protein
VKWLILCGAVFLVTACGGSPAPTRTATSPTAAVSAPSPSSSPLPSPSVAVESTPTPPPALPSPIPTPALPVTLSVGNTGGEGVYLRASPKLDDKLSAWPDGSVMLPVEDVVSANGQTWRHVSAPDGTVGWIPITYLITTMSATVTALPATSFPATATSAPTVAKAAPTQVPTITPKPVATVVVVGSGAMAKCRDGSLSYSANHRGTWSHHGGVAVWYR